MTPAGRQRRHRELIRAGPDAEGAEAGRLRQIIEAAALELLERSGGRKAGRPGLNRVTVLSAKHDPYLKDTPMGHVRAGWFRDQVDRFIAPHQTVHLRGLHYKISSPGNIKKPLGIKGSRIRYGEQYRNSDDDWVWLQEQPSADARWLGYTPWERIHDARNIDALSDYTDPPPAGELPPLW